jgi:hypothetical protein
MFSSWLLSVADTTVSGCDDDFVAGNRAGTKAGSEGHGDSVSSWQPDLVCRPYATLSCAPRSVSMSRMRGCVRWKSAVLCALFVLAVVDTGIAEAAWPGGDGLLAVRPISGAGLVFVSPSGAHAHIVAASVGRSHSVGTVEADISATDKIRLRGSIHSKARF